MAAELLRAEVNKKRRDTVWISGVCDPYQPLEAKFKLTRQCLEILAQNDWPVVIQTRSPLVLRDLDILKQAQHFEVGLSITTADDDIRKLFEPHAPPIAERLRALDELHRSGIKTYAMIAPILPGAKGLANALEGKVDYILVDRMNYNYADWVYTKHGLQDKLSDDYFCSTGSEIASECKELGIDCRLTF
jgi:DNA repair photolyase